LKISGVSFKDGINFLGEKSYVTAKISNEGTQEITLVQTKDLKNNLLSNIPVLRYYINSTKTIVKSITLLFICICIDISKIEINQVGKFYIILGIILGSFISLLYISLYCRNFFGFHGAEHKAINSYNLYKDISLENIIKSSRIASGCSINCILLYFFILLISVTILRKLYFIFVFFNYGISRELFMKDIDKNPLFFIVFKLGAFLQNTLLTKEPTDEQLVLAHNSISKLIDYEDKILNV
jgi:uncharacterized protein YqhQ